MKLFHQYTAAVFLLLSATFAHSAEPVAWKFRPGEEVTYEVKQTQVAKITAPDGRLIDSAVEQVTTLTWKCTEQLDSGTMAIEQKIESIQVTLAGLGQPASQYDTKNPNTVEGAAAMLAPLCDALVASPQKLTLSPAGELKFGEPSETLAETVEKSPAGVVSARAVLENLAAALTVPLPIGAAEPGVKTSLRRTIEAPEPLAGPAAMSATYEFVGPRVVEGQKLVVFRPTWELAEVTDGGTAAVTLGPQTTTGEVLFDPALGRLESSDVVHKIELETSAGEQLVEGVNEVTFSVRRVER